MHEVTISPHVWLQAIATANPPLYATQREAYEAYSSRFALEPAEDDLYRRLLLEGPIVGRHIGMDSTAEVADQHPDQLQARFVKYARATAAEAARRALACAGLSPDHIGGLVVNTCTGYLCPGLSSYVAEDLGLTKDIRAMDLAGMGCGAALPNLECATALARTDSARPLLSIAVEICSATLFMGPEPELVVSNSIFGDGASALVLSASSHPPQGAVARVVGHSSVLHPEYREQLRYRHQGGRLRNFLTLKVPAIGARLAGSALEKLLAPRGLTNADIRWWAVHAGGTTVLEQVGERLGLSAEALCFSLDTFRRYGNMSSPTVMFGLESILRSARPAAGDLGVLLAFGAGFSAYGALLEFTGCS